MFYILSKTLDVLVAPLTWAVVLALFALPFGRPERARKRAWLGASAVAILCAFSVEPVSNRLMLSVESSARQTYRPTIDYDVAIVLGGLIERRVFESHRDAMTYNESVERLLVAYDLFRSGRAHTLLLTSGGVEVDAMRAQLVRWGVPDSRIVLDRNAANTHDNAVNSARMVREHEWHSVVMITSRFHMQRARECFQAAGLPVDTLPVDPRTYDPRLQDSTWLPRASALETSTEALRELTGRLVYRIRGYSASVP